MAAAVSFPNVQSKPSEAKLEDEKLRLARVLIASLSEETRAILARELAGNAGLEGATTTGVLATVLRLVPRGQTITAAQLRQEVAERGIEAPPKEIYNAIGYLARTGRLVRVGYGRYVVDGIEIGTSDELGGERDRYEDLSDDQR